MLERLPQIPDSYFGTRSPADLVERAQAVTVVRIASGQLIRVLHAIMEPVGLVACLTLLDAWAFLPCVAALGPSLEFLAAGALASLSTGLASHVNVIERIVESLAAAAAASNPLPVSSSPVTIHVEGRLARNG